MPYIVVIGPSGAGKSTLTDKYIANNKDCILNKTYTTRPKRSTSDSSHIFVTKAKFNELKLANKFIYTADVFGYSYGLPKMPKLDHNVVFVLLRAQFIDIFSKFYPNSIIVQIEAPIKILEERLKTRGDKNRLNKDVTINEIAHGRRVASIIIDNNQPLDESYEEFSAICKLF